jgi:hypothetical protein
MRAQIEKLNTYYCCYSGRFWNSCALYFRFYIIVQTPAYYYIQRARCVSFIRVQSVINDVHMYVVLLEWASPKILSFLQDHVLIYTCILLQDQRKIIARSMVPAFLLGVVLLAPATAAFAQSTPQRLGGWFVPSTSRGYYHNCRYPPCTVPPPSYRPPTPQYPTKPTGERSAQSCSTIKF